MTLPAAVQLQPQFDVADLLPPSAAERLRALRLRAKESHAIVPPYEDIREASAARTNAANALKRLLAPASEGGFKLAPDDQRVIVATKAVEKAEAEFQRLQERQAARSAAWQASSLGLANVENWLRDGRPAGTVLQDHPTPDVKLNKGESVTDGVLRLQRRVRELRADLHRIESAPFPSSHARARMRAQIEALATQGAPSVTLLVEHDGEVEFQTRQAQAQVFNAQPGAVGFAEMPDAVALVAWLHRDAFIAALDKEIAAESDDKAALSTEQRQKAEAEAMSDLLAVERDEAALVWRAQSEGLSATFRADINPLAILQVELVTRPNGHLPETTPGHSYDIVRPGGGRR